MTYSISNGKYYVSSSSPEFHLSNVLINKIQTIVGIPQKDYNWNSCIFTVQTNKKDQYGYVRVERGTSLVGFLTFNSNTLIISPNLDDTVNQTFIFSTDGRIILPLKNPIIAITNNNSTLIVDTELRKYQWRFSTFVPAKNGFKNMWNIDPYHYEVLPEDAKEFFYKDNLGNCSHPISRHNCDSNETELRFEPGNIGRNPVTYCLRTKFDNSYKNACCAGDLSILKSETVGDFKNVLTNKFDGDKCKLVHGGPINSDGCNYVFSNPDINEKVKTNNEKVGVWFPFSKDCANTDITKNFCLQVDTLTNTPMLTSNPNCRNWCKDNPNECNDVKKAYCEDNPQDSNCVDWCDKKDIKSDVCIQTLRNFCKGGNLASDSCKHYCEKKDVSCDSELRDYCMSLGDEAINEPICGCFMGTPFYKNFFNSLSGQGVAISIPDADCFYPKCVNSSIKTTRWKNLEEQKKATCPNINQCINKIVINVDGTIDTKEFKIEQKNVCHWGLRPSDCNYDERIDSQTNSCVKCPGDSHPSGDKKNCLCYGTQILKNDKCVCPDTFIFTDDKKSCKCPDTFILSDDGKNCICPEGKVKGLSGFCEYPDTFTLELVDYIRQDMPINNEIDKGKVIISSDDIANAVLKNGCNQSLEIAKECSNFIPEICSIKGSVEYCKQYEDPEFCQLDKTPRNITSVYGFQCDRIRKPIKIECKEKDQYYDLVEKICKSCPGGMVIKKDKSGCEKISVDCKENEYLDEDSNTCVNCGNQIIGEDGHSCVDRFDFQRELVSYIQNKKTNEYDNIDNTSVSIYAETIAGNILKNGDCNLNLENSKECVETLLKNCNSGEDNVYGFQCKNIVLEKPEKDNKVIFIVIGVVLFFIVIGLLLKKKKN